MGIAIYTCITGGKDSLKDQPQCEGYDMYCYSDQVDKPTKEGQWTLLPIVHKARNSRRTSRFHKANPHLLPELDSYDWTIWIDGSMVLRCSPQFLVNKVLKSEALIGCRPHPVCKDLYQEAELIKRHGYEDPEVLQNQIELYQKEGFPKYAGHHETGLLVRSNDSATENFNNKWWHEINTHSQRDQMSFDYVRWNTGTKIYPIDRALVHIRAHSKKTTKEE